MLTSITVGQVLEIEDEKATTNTTEQATTSKATTTVSASDGLSAEDAAAKEWIAQKESSGSYTAQNGQYYGRYQLSLSYLNGDLSPENQEKVANQYVVNRYGSWSAAKTSGWPMAGIKVNERVQQMDSFLIYRLVNI